MAKKQKENKNTSSTPVVSGKKFRNPVNNIAGKIMLWVLCIAMVIGIVASIVFVVYNLLTTV